MDVRANINYRNKTATVSCPSKTSVTYTIRPAPGGFIFYEIVQDVGSVPKELSGKYSGLDVAVDMLKHHIRHMKQTQTSKNEELAELRAKRKGAQKNAKDDAKGS